MSRVNLLVRLGTSTLTAIRRRNLTTTRTLRATASSQPRESEATSSSTSHSPDSYAKDVDYTPALDSKLHRIDGLNENVQKPYEAPSGEFSRTGAMAAEYAATNKSDQPYAPKAEGEKQRYGGKESWVKDKGPETSNPGEGPTGSDAGGRKAEGRS